HRDAPRQPCSAFDDDLIHGVKTPACSSLFGHELDAHIFARSGRASNTCATLRSRSRRRLPLANAHAAMLNPAANEMATLGLELVAPRPIALPRPRRARVAKRAVDVVGAVIAIVLAAPIMLATWIALRLTTRGSPIFVQERCGLGGRTFRFYKFRTM